MADLYIHYGGDPAAMTYALMERAEVASQLHGGMHVVVKPNLVVARPADGGATTHPEVVEGVLRYLREHGVKRITIAEGSWVGDNTLRAWKVCGYEDLARRYGVELVDTKSDSVIVRSARGFTLQLCRTVAEADFLINVPVLKGHCQTDMTCCLKNLKGCIPDSEKRRYHTMGLHKPIAALNTLLRPHLHIVDGVCGDLSFEEGGNPVHAGRILLGRDGLLTDSYCAGLMGFRPEDIGYLRIAQEYGVGRFCDRETQVEELGAQHKPKAVAGSGSAGRRLARYIDEDGACSACYAALVHALDRCGRSFSSPVKIGQGFRGKTFGGVGVGSCAAGCERSLPGCPPRAVDIVEFLQQV